MMSEKSPIRISDQTKRRLHTKETFVEMSLEPERSETPFSVITTRFVRIEVDGHVWIKRDCLIAYHGELKFRREQIFQSQAIEVKTGPLREAMKRELVPLTKAEGKGVLFVSDEGRHNQIIHLDGGSVWVLSSCVVAFQPTLRHEVKTIGGVGLLAGGLFLIKLSGHGYVAISMKGDPLTLRVREDDPVSCDPTAAVSWSGSLWPELKTNVELKSLIGQGGGAVVQMLFKGDGYVVVHARSRLAAVRNTVLKKATSKVKRFL